MCRPEEKAVEVLVLRNCQSPYSHGHKDSVSKLKEIDCFPLFCSSLLPQQTDFGCPLASGSIKVQQSYFIFCLLLLTDHHSFAWLFSWIKMRKNHADAPAWGMHLPPDMSGGATAADGCAGASLPSIFGAVQSHRYITESR